MEGKGRKEKQPSPGNFLLTGNRRSVPELLSSRNTLTRTVDREL